MAEEAKTITAIGTADPDVTNVSVTVVASAVSEIKCVLAVEIHLK